MKRLLLILIALIAHPSQGQSFTNAIGGGNVDVGHAIVECSNGDVFVAGVTNSFGAGSGDICFARLDATGNVLWEKTYGTSSNEDGSAVNVLETSDGGFLICGYSQQTGSDYDMLIFKVDASGNLLWSKSYITGFHEHPRGLLEASDGNYIISGTLGGSSFGADDFFLLKLDPAGNTVWFKYYGAGSNDHLTNLNELPNGDLIASSTTQSFGPGIRVGLVVKFDPLGNIIFNVGVGGSGNDVLHELTPTLDGGYIAVGHTSSYGSGALDYFIVKFNSTNNIEWSKAFGGASDDVASAVYQDNAGDYYIYGTSSSMGTGEDLIMLKLDNLGNLVWSKATNNPGNDFIVRWATQSINPHSSGDILLTGAVINGGNTDILAAKIGTMESIFCTNTSLPFVNINPSTVTPSFSSSSHLSVGNFTGTLSNSMFSTSSYCPCFNNLSFPSNTSICPGDSATLSASGGLTYLWSNGGSLSCDSCSTVQAGPTQTTTYDVYIMSGDCIDSAQVTVNLTQPSITMPADTFICENASIPTLNGTPIGGTWSGPGIVNASNGNFDGNIAGTGTHTIYYSIANPCALIDSMTITVDVPSVSNAITPSAMCVTSPIISLNANPIGGTWSGNGIINPLLGEFDPAAAGAGNHQITYSFSSSGQCIENDTIEIEVLQSTPSTITHPDTLCINDNPIMLNAVPAGGAYAGNGVTMAGAFDPAIAGVGVHEIIYTPDPSSGVCLLNDTAEITVVQPSISMPIDTLICSLSSASNFSATPAGGSWSGNGIIDNQLGIFDPAGLIAGNHTIYYTINSPCPHVDSFVVTVVYPDTADISHPLSLCVSAPNTTFTASPSGGQWSGAGITNINTGEFSPNIAGAGLHVIIYSIPGSCTVSDTIEIEVLQSTPSTITHPDTLCINDNPIILNAVPAGGTYTGNAITMNGVFDPALAGAGLHEIIYTPDPSSGVCMLNDTAEITVVQPSISMPVDTLICSLSSPSNFSATPAGGSWSGNGIVDNQLGIFDPAGLIAGNHTIYYTINSPCSHVDSFVVTVVYPDTADITQPTSLCASAPNTVLTASPIGGQWSGTGIININSGEFSPNIAGAGLHVIIYSVPGACTVNDTIIIEVLADSIATISAPDTLCISDPNTSIVFSPVSSTLTGNGIVNNNQFDPGAAGVGFHLIMVNPSGQCPEPDSTYIVVVDTVLQLMPDTNLCENSMSIQLSAIPAGGVWSGPGVNSGSNMFNPTMAGLGSHYISYSVDNGCSIVDSILINVNPTPTVNIGNDTIICPSCGYDIILDPSFDYIWNNGSTDNSYNVTGSGVVAVTISDEFGCTASDLINVQLSCDYSVYIPNAITNNSDGLNDYLEVVAYNISNTEFYIFDRWGQQVFYTDDINAHWDGTYNGKECPVDVYVYKLKYRSCDDIDIKVIYGHVTLIR